jgi:hypothetical protein
LLFEREQIPQVVEIRHSHMESIERLEAGHIFRNQQVAGSIPAGGSIVSGCTPSMGADHRPGPPQ